MFADFTFGFIVGGAVIGTATYWISSHIGTIKADVARLEGKVEGIFHKTAVAAAPAVTAVTDAAKTVQNDAAVLAPGLVKPA